MLSWWEEGRCIFVGDAKYKRLEVGSIKHPDIYQMLAYTVAVGLQHGVLIYPKGESEATIHYVHEANKSIHVETVDLAQQPNILLAEINQLAFKIRQAATIGVDRKDRETFESHRPIA